MAYEFFELEMDGHVATLWMNRPEARNAMNPAFWRELPIAMEALGADENVRAIVIAARGPHFTAGLDLKTMGGTIGGNPGGADTEKPSEAQRRHRLRKHIMSLQDSITAVADCPKPVIAAVQGYCIGGGIDLITAADIRVCSEDTIFSIRETRIAIVADVGTLQRLPGIVGRGIAYELALTGDDFDAERAKDIHLVNEIHSDASTTVKAAQELATRIATNSPLAVEGTKQVMRYSEDKTVEEGLDYVATWNANALGSEDLMEAMSAFTQKRKPEFTGR
jgi:enoyl-CoA hydratase